MRGVVATGHAECSEAAARVLRAGGNAFDAALAAGFAAAVAEPMFTSLGGPLMARTLALLEERDAAGHRWGSAEHLSALAAVMNEVEKLRVCPAAGGTTHVSICDAAGNAASLSLSNGEGSERSLYFGGVHAVNPAGEGAGDPRREGHGGVVDSP